MPTVLMVVDSLTVLLSLKRLLEEMGHEVLAAQDGFSSLSLLLSNSPNIMVIDMDLQSVSSLDLCTIIRNMPAFASLPIVGMTPATHAYDKEVAYRHGITAFILKPVSPELLLALIDEHTTL